MCLLEPIRWPVVLMARPAGVNIVSLISRRAVSLAWRLVKLTSALTSILKWPLKLTPVLLWWSLLKLALRLELGSALLELHLLLRRLTWTAYAPKETARTRLAILVRRAIQGAEAVVAPWMLVSAVVAEAAVALQEELAHHHYWRRDATDTGIDFLLKDW